MNRLQEVKEFELITGSEAYRDQNVPGIRYCEFFDSLKNFVQEYSTRNDDSDILEFMKLGFKRNIGEYISIRNYVGVVQLRNGCQLQILPKIDFTAEDDQRSTGTKKIFLKMLRCLKDFPCKKFSNAELAVDRLNLYEIFIRMFVEETAGLVKHGLKSAYIEKQENLTVYKGKLLVNSHIKHNAAHKERFFVEFDEYMLNRPENRLIKSTLLTLLKQTSCGDTAKNIRRLLTAFELVEPSACYERDFSKVSIDRNTGEYEVLMKWAKVFLQHSSFTTFSGSGSAVSLLFPMEKVFESYVAAHLKKICAGKNMKISVQDRCCYLFDRLNGEPYRKFALRPDIVITGPGSSDCNRHERIILDTKWKRLVNDRGRNYGISQADMYQMFAYSQKYQTSEIWLLYPLNNEMRNYETIKFESTGSGGRINCTVSVFFVDLERIESCMQELIEQIEGSTPKTHQNVRLQ